MLGNFSPNYFQFLTGSDISTRPSEISAWGVSVTPGNNTYGSWAQLLAAGSVTSHCYMIDIIFNTNYTAGQIKDTLANIGIDPAGGTSYTTLIPNLLCGSNYYYGMESNGRLTGTQYSFPVFIPSGSSIACQASVNNATVGTVRCSIKIYGMPSNPQALKFGTAVESIGITSASSRGTAVTPGTTSDGTWTSLGTLTSRCCYAQIGFYLGNNNTNNRTLFADLSYGDSTNNVIIMRDVLVTTNFDEHCTLVNYPAWCSVPAGATIYGRLQCNGVADASCGMAAFFVKE